MTIEFRDQRTKRAEIRQPFDQATAFVDWIDSIRSNIQLATTRFAVLLQTFVEQMTEVKTTRIDTKIILRFAKKWIQLSISATNDDLLWSLQRRQHFDRIFEAYRRRTRRFARKENTCLSLTVNGHHGVRKWLMSRIVVGLLRDFTGCRYCLSSFSRCCRSSEWTLFDGHGR